MVKAGCVVIALVAGCLGKIEELPVDEFDDPEVSEACKTRTVPVQPLRRLSSRQYANVLRDLLGTELAEPLIAGSVFPQTVITRGFTNDADANSVNTSQSNAIEEDAERIARTILANPTPWLKALLPCGGPDACIDQFITAFGQRAYRRPITSDEAALIRGLYDQIRATQSATAAWASVLQFFVQSPALLYRIERGGDLGPAANLVKLAPYEMAGRLSFLFLDSGPDGELFAAAERGELVTKDQLAAQARRLMQDPRFPDVLASFHHDWLRGYELKAKDSTFTSYTAVVQDSLANELSEITSYLFNSGGTIADVLGTTRIPVNPTLAAFYGVPAPASGWVPTVIPHRRGILTVGSVQAALAGSMQSSPIHRGLFVRSQVLCRPPIAFPAGVDTAAPLADSAGAATARQRLAPLLANPDCAGCHAQFNPLGLAFENFNAIGAWRDQENGATIDASGTIDIGTVEKPNVVAFADAHELMGLVAASPAAHDCYALQWFRASAGREDTEEDHCSTSQLRSLVEKTGGDLRELMVALTQVDAFRFRRIVED